jgi:hypothetical protein
MVLGCSSVKKNKVEQDSRVSKSNDTLIPACINRLIDQFKSEEKQNPPRSIYRYKYEGKTVYYVTAPCCDFFSDLYDSACNLMGHPDGGFTGNGDGSLPGFQEKKSEEKLVWKDSRK